MSTTDKIKDILYRDNVVYEWPDDERDAYRAKGWSEGLADVMAIRAEKIVRLVKDGLLEDIHDEKVGLPFDGDHDRAIVAQWIDEWGSDEVS